MEPTAAASPVQFGLETPRQDVDMKEMKQKEEEKRANSRSPTRGEKSEEVVKTRLDAAVATEVPAAAKDQIPVINIEAEGESSAAAAAASSTPPLGDAKAASPAP